MLTSSSSHPDPYATLRRQKAVRNFYLPTPCQIGGAVLSATFGPEQAGSILPEIQTCCGARTARRRARRSWRALPRAKLRGSGLRFAVPRLQSSNDETPRKSGDIGEDFMVTRREFIGTTLVAGAALSPGAQQARPQPAS